MEYCSDFVVETISAFASLGKAIRLFLMRQHQEETLSFYQEDLRGLPVFLDFRCIFGNLWRICYGNLLCILRQYYDIVSSNLSDLCRNNAVKFSFLC